MKQKADMIFRHPRIKSAVRTSEEKTAVFPSSVRNYYSAFPKGCHTFETDDERCGNLCFLTLTCLLRSEL